MRKTLKSTFSILISLCLAIAVCPVATLAATGDIAELTIEDVTGHQLSNLITENLSLPTGYTWVSSDESVIKIGAEAGGVIPATVKRGTADKTVTLTATKGSVSEEFSLTVKNTAVEVLFADNFAYSEGKVSALTDFKFTLPAEGENGSKWMNSSIVKESNGNKYLSLDFTGTTATDYPKIMLNSEEFMSKFNAAKKVTVLMTIATTDVAKGAKDLKLGYNKVSGITPTFFTIMNHKRASTSYFSGGCRGNSSATAVRILASDASKTRWASAEITVNLDNGETRTVATEKEEYPDYIYAKTETEGDYKTVRQQGFNSIYFEKMSPDVDSGYFYIDDFAIYTETSYEDMTDTEKCEYLLNSIETSKITAESHGRITQNLKVTPADLGIEVPAGASLTWKSKNTGVITDAGVITKGNLPQTATITATVTVGEITASRDYRFTVAPLGDFIEDRKHLTTDFDGNYSGVAAFNGNAMEVSGFLPEDLVQSIEEDDNGNKVGKFSFDGTSTTTGGASRNTVSCKLKNAYGDYSTYEGRYILSFDAKYVTTTPDISSASIYIYGSGSELTTGLIPGINSIRTHNGKYFLKNGQDVDNQWHHIVMDVNAKDREYNVYVNGVDICGGVPAKMRGEDNINEWNGASPFRYMLLNLEGEGTLYLDNISEWKDNTFNETRYDETKDFTISSFAIKNQDGKQITNVSPAGTTKITASIELIRNRIQKDADPVLYLATYSSEGKLDKVTTKTIEPTTNASKSREKIADSLSLSVSNLSENTRVGAYLWVNGTLVPLTEPKSLPTDVSYDTDKLFNEDVEWSTASELGYTHLEKTSDYGTITPIFYEGTDFEGHSVKHFAYMGLPEGASKDNPVPGVVLIHGGGNTANADWVDAWLKRGYAAIAMDMNGTLPEPNVLDGYGSIYPKHEWSGASNDNYDKVSDTENTWMYNCVTEVIMAHNLLRQHEAVITDKIGFGGGSWGGVITSSALGVDNRFAFAFPVYGCGYLYDTTSFNTDRLTAERKKWDPSSFFTKSTVPTLWINSDDDHYFPMTLTSRSYEAQTQSENKKLLIDPELTHSIQQVMGIDEIYAFADYCVGRNDAKAFVTVNDVVVENGTAKVSIEVPSGVSISSSKLYYTKTEKLDGDRTTPNYTIVEGDSGSGSNDVYSFSVPSDAKWIYINFTDSRGLTSSSKVTQVNAE